MRILPDFHLELAEGDDRKEPVCGGSNRDQVLLPSSEVSRVHVADHASDIQCFHICILERYKSTSMHDDAQEVNVVVLFAQLVTPKDAVESLRTTLTS